jgi:neutral ceramidase
MGSDLVNQRVVERLRGRTNNTLCRLENLSITGSSTHSAPGGFLQYASTQVTNLGFSSEMLETIVEGVVQAILRAQESLQPGTLKLAQALLFDANVNRSPSSYLLNPASERELYADLGDTDKTMTQLMITAASGQDLGVLNWFAVQGTSMNSSNHLISGDNKGYASYLMEKQYNGNESLPGRGSFVAAFASTNLGDASPNTAGSRCVDTGLPCDFTASTCNGQMKLCVGSGPGHNMWDSTEIIGRKQFEMAVNLLHSSNTTVLEAEVSFRHSFVDFSNLNITLDNGDMVSTCPAALGYGFAAGTTDGPGTWNFQQGANSSNPFWDVLSHFLSIPTEEQTKCHSPKPILLNTGLLSRPYDWDPSVLPISIFRVDRFFLLNVPAAFTTMAGRRLRKAVQEVLIAGGVANPVVTIAGLANSYSYYVTTFEEYGEQRYEAASTLYGPHTLSAYIQEFRRISLDLLENRLSETSASPRDSSKRQVSFIPPVALDTIGLWRDFGSVAVDAKDAYTVNQSVVVSFRSASPRNDHRIEGTFLTVDILDEYGHWQTLYVDGDWCTKLIWKGEYLA